MATNGCCSTGSPPRWRVTIAATFADGGTRGTDGPRIYRNGGVDRCVYPAGGRVRLRRPLAHVPVLALGVWHLYRRAVGNAVRLTLKERLFSKVIPVTESGCWLWEHEEIAGGYGRIRCGGTKQLAHRVSYELLKGSIPHGMTLDHLCRVSCCINPDHLEPVTMRENILRGTGVGAVNSKKQSCKNGHIFDLVNTYLSHAGSRVCRACDRMRYYKNKEIVLRKRAEFYQRNAEHIKKRVMAYKERKRRDLNS